jgi:Cu+-exporting ATPase
MALEPAGIPQAKATEWTCPMHPEVIASEPGPCPICGMALEPKAVSIDDEASPELKDMWRRFVLAAVFTLPLVVVSMGDLIPGEPISATLSAKWRIWIELGLATPVCLWSAWPFYVRAIQSVANRALNMFTLIGLGVTASWRPWRRRSFRSPSGYTGMSQCILRQLASSLR